MAKKNSIAQLKDLRVGKTVWLVRWDGIKRATISNTYRNSVGYFIQWGKDTLSQKCSLGDSGVVDPYDQRPAQIFTNKRAAEFFSKHWGGANPNFLIKNPHNNTVIASRKHDDVLDPLDWMWE